MPLSERAPKVLAGAAELQDGTGSWSGVGSPWILILPLTYFLAGLYLDGQRQLELSGALPHRRRLPKLRRP